MIPPFTLFFKTLYFIKYLDTIIWRKQGVVKCIFWIVYTLFIKWNFFEKEVKKSDLKKQFFAFFY